MISMMTLAETELNTYLPILVMLVAAITFGVGNITLTRLLGPTRNGQNKGIAYESGMNPVTSSRKRFNVRFYLIAMVFLVFDVEVVFLYPWATTFGGLDTPGERALLWLGRILFFLATTVVAYLYGFRKGVFKFD